MKAHEIAAKAADLVGGDREKQHGSKRRNFQNIAELWNGYLSTRPDHDLPLSAIDVGHLMVLLKVARTQLGSFNPDDYVDGAGYMACAGEIAADVDAEAQRAVEGEESVIGVGAWPASMAPSYFSFAVGDEIVCGCEACKYTRPEPVRGVVKEVLSAQYFLSNGYCVPRGNAHMVVPAQRAAA